jgi:hypothetical protein
MENNTISNELIKFMHNVLMSADMNDLANIKEFLSEYNFTQENFDMLCIYHYTQNIRITDGFICGCSFLQMCRIAEATGIKPSGSVSDYISQRMNSCGGTSEITRVKSVLNIECRTPISAQ